MLITNELSSFHLQILGIQPRVAKKGRPGYEPSLPDAYALFTAAIGSEPGAPADAGVSSPAAF